MVTSHSVNADLPYQIVERYISEQVTAFIKNVLKSAPGESDTENVTDLYFIQAPIGYISTSVAFGTQLKTALSDLLQYSNAATWHVRPNDCYLPTISRASVC